MKMLRAVVRPEHEWEVSSALAKNGFRALTKWDVLGRGNQQGIQVGSQIYDDLAKSMMLIVVEDHQVQSAVKTIEAAAYSGFPGDGKIFVTPVDEAYTVRTGKPEL